MPGEPQRQVEVQCTVLTAACRAAAAGEARLLQLMAMLGPGWGDLRPHTANAMLQQLTLMLQVWGSAALCKRFPGV